jgi:hypothetical protein
MRDRLHLHREANPERKIERFSKSDKSERAEKLARENLDASHAARPSSATPVPEESHADGGAAIHVNPSVATVSSPNGTIADANRLAAESLEAAAGAGEHHEGDGSPHPGHSPKGGTS